MCTTCGCSDGAAVTITDRETGEQRGIGVHVHMHDHDGGHHHHHHHDDGHVHRHARAHGTTITLEQEVLAKNNHLAGHNRAWFQARNIVALNLVSSPGAGKTTLLERTIRDVDGEIPISVIEGDQETVFDAERIRATGCAAVQINTGTGCHLDAAMLADALEQLEPPADSVVMIENVGNLVCPALFDLGEHAKVAILSVTEGADKPLKYPHMFRAASLMIINKTDLLAYVDFDVDACIGHARRVNPDIEVLQVSATTGEGLGHWYAWLRSALERTRSPDAAQRNPGDEAPLRHRTFNPRGIAAVGD